MIWSDNKGAEGTIRKGGLPHKCVRPIASVLYYLKGCSKSFDHNSLVHVIWKRCAELRLGIWVERVPTKVNIADDPSR